MRGNTTMSNREDFRLTRRTFAGVAATGALATMAPAAVAATRGGDGTTPAVFSKPGSYWPNGARLAISMSLMFEGGGQPISGAGGAVPEVIKPGYPDQVTNAFFDYGVNEGIPRAPGSRSHTCGPDEEPAFTFGTGHKDAFKIGVDANPRLISLDHNILEKRGQFVPERFPRAHRAIRPACSDNQRPVSIAGCHRISVAPEAIVRPPWRTTS
jgi:hypothetical protein